VSAGAFIGTAASYAWGTLSYLVACRFVIGLAPAVSVLAQGTLRPARVLGATRLRRPVLLELAGTGPQVVGGLVLAGVVGAWGLSPGRVELATLFGGGLLAQVGNPPSGRAARERAAADRRPRSAGGLSLRVLSTGVRGLQRLTVRLSTHTVPPLAVTSVLSTRTANEVRALQADVGTRGKSV
jgi:hypothetical protein